MTSASTGMEKWRQTFLATFGVMLNRVNFNCVRHGHNAGKINLNPNAGVSDMGTPQIKGSMSPYH